MSLVLAGLFQAGQLNAQSSSTTTEKGLGGTVYLHETFDNYSVDAAPQSLNLERSEQVTVIEGGDKVGSGKVAHFNDSDDEVGAMEYNVGKSKLGDLYAEFDARNNDPAKGDKSSKVTFSVGAWTSGRTLAINSKAKRGFGLEMYQQKYLKLRVGDDLAASKTYDSAAAFNVKIWVNDHDTNTLSYKRPDNGEAAALNADSVVVWVNNALLGDLKPAGHKMNAAVTKGDAVIGRVGFNSGSTKLADFMIDNLHIEDGAPKAEAAAGDGSEKKK